MRFSLAAALVVRALGFVRAGAPGRAVVAEVNPLASLLVRAGTAGAALSPEGLPSGSVAVDGRDVDWALDEDGELTLVEPGKGSVDDCLMAERHGETLHVFGIYPEYCDDTHATGRFLLKVIDGLAADLGVERVTLVDASKVEVAAADGKASLLLAPLYALTHPKHASWYAAHGYGPETTGDPAAAAEAEARRMQALLDLPLGDLAAIAAAKAARLLAPFKAASAEARLVRAEVNFPSDRDLEAFLLSHRQPADEVAKVQAAIHARARMKDLAAARPTTRLRDVLRKPSLASLSRDAVEALESTLEEALWLPDATGEFRYTQRRVKPVTAV